MAAIDDLLRDNATLSKQRDNALHAIVTASAGADKSRLMALPIGTKVLDLITGLEGVVIDGHRENVIIPAAR